MMDKKDGKDAKDGKTSTALTRARVRASALEGLKRVREQRGSARLTEGQYQYIVGRKRTA